MGHTARCRRSPSVTPREVKRNYLGNIMDIADGCMYRGRSIFYATLYV